MRLTFQLFLPCICLANLTLAQELWFVPESTTTQTTAVHWSDSTSGSSMHPNSPKSAQSWAMERVWSFGNLANPTAKLPPREPVRAEAIWLSPQLQSTATTSQAYSPGSITNPTFAIKKSSRRLRSGQTSNDHESKSNAELEPSLDADDRPGTEESPPVQVASNQTVLLGAEQNASSKSRVEPAIDLSYGSGDDISTDDSFAELKSAEPLPSKVPSAWPANFLNPSPIQVTSPATPTSETSPSLGKAMLDVSSMLAPTNNPTTLFQRLDIENDFRSVAVTTSQNIRADAQSLQWMLRHYTWISPVFYHEPLYFEQPNLERYGLGTVRCLQPVVSSAHFFGSIPLIPAKLLRQAPCERVYTLGSYRPGDCVPRQGHFPIHAYSSAGTH